VIIGGFDLGRRSKNRVRVLLLVAVALGAIFAVAAQADMGAPDPASVKHRITDIQIEGNKAVPDAELLAAINIKVGDRLSETEVKERVSDVLKVGKLSNAVPRLEPTAGGSRLIVTVQEYPEIKGYRFNGNTVLSDNELSDLMSLKAGDVLDTNVLDEDLSKILSEYEERGYSVAVSGVSLTSDGFIDVKLIEHRIGDIIIEGNKKTRPEVIEREIDVKPGDLVNLERIRDSVSRLHGLGIFSEVMPTLEPTSAEGVLNLKLQVTEARTGAFAAGMGYNSSDGLFGYLQVGDNNLLGRNYKLALSVEVGKDVQNYALTFANPWVDSKRTSLEAAVYSRSGQRDGHSELRRGGRLVVGRPLNEETRVDLTFKVEDVDSEWPDKQPVGIAESATTRSVGFRVMNDTRDNSIHPTAGGVIRGSVELAGGLLGGDYSYNKYELQATRFFGLRPNQTIGLRVGYGTSTGELPFHELYEVGGSDNLRGYDYREFLGSNMIYANAEYRYKINDTVQAVAFVDAGDAWSDGSIVKVSDLKVGCGVGVRLITPIGIIRLDYGIGRDGGNTYFSLGQTF